MFTGIRSAKTALASAIVVASAAAVSGCGGEEGAAVQVATAQSASPQLKSVLVACNRDRIGPYSLTLLDSLGGDRSWVTAINNRGQVVGASRVADGTNHAVVWNGAAVTDLEAGRAGNSIAYDINEAGRIVGQATAPSGWWIAASWSHGGVTYLDTPPGGTSTANGINNAGKIVGSREASPNSAGVPSVWNKGRVSALGTLGGIGASSVSKVNAAGDIVGSSTTAAGEEHPTLWKNGHAIDLGTLGGPSGAAYAINNRGQIVGWSSAPYGSGVAAGPAIWYRGTVQALGNLGAPYGYAVAINNPGQIVGRSAISAEQSRPVIWPSATDAPVDIATLVDDSAAGLRIDELNAINDRGQIAGTAVLADGSTRAMLLTPTGCH